MGCLTGEAGAYSGMATASNLPKEPGPPADTPGRFLPSRKWICRARLLSDFAPQNARTAASARPPENDGRSDKDRGISSDHHADDNSKGKVAQNRAAEEKEAKNRDERHRAGKNCAA
jgi:hypothetical protein